MNALGLFAANVGDILQIVVIILVVLATVIGKIISAMHVPQRNPGQQRPPALPQQQPQPQEQIARPKSVKEEIDEFLRRAAQKRQIPSGSGNAPRPISQPGSAFARREEPIEAEVVRDNPVGGEVGEHVKKYLDETQFDQRAAKLGGDVATADTKIEQHLKEVFGHGLSKLSNRPGETATPSAPKPTGFFQDEVPALAAAGTGLASLLNNVDNLRQAIVLNEILQRPVDRWK